MLGQRVTIAHAKPSYSLVDVAAPPFVLGSPPHLHRDYEGLFYRNPINKSSGFITTFSSGGFEKFFSDIGASAVSSDAPASSVK